MKNDTWLRTGTKTFGSKTKSYEECMHGTKWGEASTKKECLVGARGKKKKIPMNSTNDGQASSIEVSHRSDP